MPPPWILCGTIGMTVRERAPRPPELIELEALLGRSGRRLPHRVVREIDTAQGTLPVLAIALGNPDPQVPAVGFFGGVHGLERIGVRVVLTYLGAMAARLDWDATLAHQLQGMRMVFMPLVNPGGLLQGTRANPRGVDLMRNAPVDCEGAPPFLIGGQRMSAALPWFRGQAGAPMEAEAQALCEVVRDELLSHRFAIALDCHSGFGLSDRIWFPHAHTARPVEHLPELQALSQLLDAALPHHRYVFEPQSRHYLASGDLWDHLYLASRVDASRTFLPLTLEMGSWLWVKKNPRQIFSREGIFNPLIDHRQQRVLRRHMGLLEFVGRAAFSHARWSPDAARRVALGQGALARWYGPAATR